MRSRCGKPPRLVHSNQGSKLSEVPGLLWPGPGRVGVQGGRSVLTLRHQLPVLWPPEYLKFSG